MPRFPDRTFGPLWLGLLAVLACSSPQPIARQAPLAASPSPTRVAAAPVDAEVVASPAVSASPAPEPMVLAVETSSIRATPSPGVPVEAEFWPRSTLALSLPGPASPRTGSSPELASLLGQARVSGMAAHWRKAGEKALQLQLYQQAVLAFRREAAIYRSKGILQAALAQEARANQYATELSLYLGQPAGPAGKLERLEPAAGCLIGAFIDRDDNLRQFMLDSQTHGDVDQFNQMVGKDHASFFMYRAYGQPFPTRWAEYLKERQAIVHIAWEPKSLDDVRDDSYLREFVDALVELDHPVILRFASEMNGEWTPYHGDPEEYKAAFRLVHRATRRAPKVALLWCPNTIPRQGLESYYPGDDAVDWVGVNFYSVPFLDNDPKRPGDKIHPTDHLQAVYDLYAARKPIAVGEWAASRQSKIKAEPTTEFAKVKISQLYGTLPTRYPRVKLVNWYGSNNLREATPSRQLNNYQVTSPSDLRAHYGRAVASPYFLGAGQTSSRIAYRPLVGRTRISAETSLRIALKSYEQRPKVYFRVNGSLVLATADALDWRLSPNHWKPGKNVVEVLVYDRKDRFVTSAKAVLDLPG